MPSPIELALTSLLPTANHLPPELIHLATSLVAQSRLKASTLKPEEEIGRTYACCQIAAEALANRLALEISKPSPPCPPRIYGKLLKFLQSVVSTSASTNVASITTPKANRSVGRGDETNDGVRGKGVGTVNRTPMRNRTPLRKGDEESPFLTAMTSTRKRKIEGEKADDEAAAQKVMSVIRTMCKALGEPKAAPHVFVGADVLGLMESLASGESEETNDGPPAKRRATSTARLSKSKAQADHEGSEQVRSIARLIAICILVVTRIKGGGDDTDRSRQCQTALEAAMMSDWIQARVAPSSNEKVSLEAETQLDKVFNECHQSDWFTSIPIATQPSNTEPMDQEEDSATSLRSSRPNKTPLRRKEKHDHASSTGIESLGSAGLLPGLGTMFQPAVDWLSEERKHELAIWKKSIKQRIAVAERAR